MRPEDLPMGDRILPNATCEKCGLEIEEEAIAKDGKPYHYRCSGIEP